MPSAWRTTGSPAEAFLARRGPSGRSSPPKPFLWPLTGQDGASYLAGPSVAHVEPAALRQAGSPLPLLLRQRLPLAGLQPPEPVLEHVQVLDRAHFFQVSAEDPQELDVPSASTLTLGILEQVDDSHVDQVALPDRSDRVIIHSSARRVAKATLCSRKGAPLT